MLLALDTSTQQAGLALFDGAVRAELSWQAGRQHAAQLLPQLERLLTLVGLDQQALRAVAAARGPGSFTGLRIGLATAQGLALALGVPLYGVCTLDVLAAGFETSCLPVRPLVEAGRGRFASACYDLSADGPIRRSEIVGLSLDQLPELVQERTVLCGDLSAADRARVRAMLGDMVTIASPAASVRRPAVLAQLAWERWSRGESGEAALEPLYLTR
jgi:tRNA threonylcarbamoyladenosine biosynthesis protein TsaB